MADKEPMCFIAREECGCILSATLDQREHKEATARTVGRWIRQGRAVERMTVKQAKADPLFFPKECPHKGAQVEAVK